MTIQNQPDARRLEGISFRRPSSNDDDLIVVADAAFTRSSPRQIALRELPSPFAIAESRGIDLPATIRSDSVSAAALINELASETESIIGSISSSGFDGTFYRLTGAEPAKLSPMQYGGLFFEHDWNLISAARKTGLVVVFADVGEDAYFDVIASLPCTVLAYDAAKSKISGADLRRVTSALLAPGTDQNGVILFQIQADNFGGKA
jgi:hypothetical protein